MVTTAPLTRPLTYDDLAAMPDDGKRYELINGELYELTGPTPKHQRSSRRLLVRIDRFVESNELGEVFSAPIDVYFTPHIVVQPDIVYISHERQDVIREQKIEGTPNILMEVLSPSNRKHDIVTKAAIYALFGVPEYWIVDPEAETIRVQILRDGVYGMIESIDGIARSHILPGFEVDPVEIFSTPEWMQPAQS